MVFLKRAGLYCIRQRFKTLILFLVLTLIASLILTGIAIRDAVSGAAKNVKAAVGGTIELNLDHEGHMGAGEQNAWGTSYSYNGDLISKEIVDAIEKVEGVADYNSENTGSYYGAGVDFQYLPASLGLSYTKYGEASSYTATLSSEKCRSFQNGNYQLVAGRHITPKDRYVCMLSKELADYNQLSVGDKVRMYSLDSDSETTFELVGIFDGTEGTDGNTLTVDEIPANCGYIDYAAVEDIFKYLKEESGYQQLTIYVKDPMQIQTVYDQIAALPELKGKTLKLTINTEAVDTISAPLESLQKAVHTTMILIFVVSIVVLTLLLTIWIRGRKNEIAILLSIGNSKINIISQIFMESLFVAVISFASSIPLSISIAGKVGAYIISRASMELAELKVQIDTSSLLPFYLIGVSLIAVSVLASSWTIVRLQPKEILTKMS